MEINFDQRTDRSKNVHRVSQKEKDENDYQWYKDRAEDIGRYRTSGSSFMTYGEISNFKRKKVNYDLFNGIINPSDFAYVCKPFGAKAGELPAKFANRDIVSSKIKVMLGMEMSMPFSWKVLAVNEEATTRKEQYEAKLLRDYVVGQVMNPIRKEIEAELMQQAKGRELSYDELQQLRQAIDQETQARTPDEVRKYMRREHQDPAEVLMSQLLQYTISNEKVIEKFNEGWKHALISGEEIYWVGIINGKPAVRVVNPLYFEYDVSPDETKIQKGEWAVCTYKMTRSSILSQFSSVLKEKDIDKIYDSASQHANAITDADFNFTDEEDFSSDTLDVVHYTFKSLKKIGFLSYLDRNDELQERIVDENYRPNKKYGDIAVRWEWIPEAHEVYRVLDDIWLYPRPIPGQYKDLNNLYECNLPYYGAALDNTNSPTTSPMDRVKAYQYYYNVILYRIDLLMASDKGKMIAANINAIPSSTGIDPEKFMYFAEANKFAWFDPTEEGMQNSGNKDMGSLASVLDMSLASDIAKYIDLAEYIERKAGESVGVTKPMEGLTAPSEAVSNAKQNIVQSSHVIRPYFELHNNVKGDVLTALVETNKVAYSGDNAKKLAYVLDDMSQTILSVDNELLDASSYGLFVANSSKAEEAKQAVQNLAHAAMQTQQAEFADVIKVIRADSIVEAEEQLTIAGEKKAEQAMAAQQAQLEADERKFQRESMEKQKDRDHDLAKIKLQEEEKRKTQKEVQLIESLGFAENKDADGDGTPDVLEVAQFGLDANIKRGKQQLEQKKQSLDEKKLQLEEKKFKHEQEYDEEHLKIERRKANKPTSSK